ncbi:hypothetical protein AA313_de0202389 [Arthrobotrys entomopaga]|nr:hypothetical protein AA313_de0202389 [Arthrobotrys entomopaga]
MHISDPGAGRTTMHELQQIKRRSDGDIAGEPQIAPLNGDATSHGPHPTEPAATGSGPSSNDCTRVGTPNSEQYRPGNGGETLPNGTRRNSPGSSIYAPLRAEREARGHKSLLHRLEDNGFSREVEWKHVRDHLALERTFLGWLRTSGAFAMTGVLFAQIAVIVMNNEEMAQRTGLVPQKTGHSDLIPIQTAAKPIAVATVGIALATVIIGVSRFYYNQKALIEDGSAVSGGWPIVVLAAKEHRIRLAEGVSINDYDFTRAMMAAGNPEIENPEIIPENAINLWPHRFMPNSVYYLPDTKSVLKVGYSVKEIEAESLRLLKSKTTVPVPELYGFHEKDGKGYLHMSKIEGKQLAIVWETFSEEKQAKIAFQLHGYVKQWQGLTSDVYGAIEYGPYASREEYNAGLAEAIANSRPAGVIDQFQEDITQKVLNLGLDDNAKVFSHGDLHRGNIMVNEDGEITGIVDWETACFSVKDRDYFETKYRARDQPWSDAIECVFPDDNKVNYSIFKELEQELVVARSLVPAVSYIFRRIYESRPWYLVTV